MRNTYRLLFAVPVFLAVLTMEGKANAYTDPGVGMLIWQGLAAAFLGASFYFRKFLLRFLPGKKNDQEKQ